MELFSSVAGNVALNTGIICISILFLWKGADFLVESASRIAETFGVSDLVIGLTVVAFGTSAPEFAVTVSAAIKGQSNISVSNIVGSDIFNLGIVLGVVAVLSNIKSSKRLVYRDGIFLIGISFLLLYVFHDHTLTRPEGFAFIILLVSYLIFLFVKKEVLEEEEFPHEKSSLKDYILLPLSLVMVVAGGHFLVDSSTMIARTIGISDWLIGVTIVAAGTSAPELATSLTAALKGKHGMSAGNLIGSDIFNILGVLGVAASFNSLSIDSHGYRSLIMLSLMVVLVILLLRRKWRLTRNEGIILICAGLLRWILDFML